MPYIAEKDRPVLDKHIDALADEIRRISCQYDYAGAFAGLLNYTCTRLAMKVIPTTRYWTIALVSGIFHNIADEFYRRVAATYEDAQIIKNGDVPEYKEG